MAADVERNIGLSVCTGENGDGDCQYLAEKGLNQGCFYDDQMDQYHSCKTICHNRENLIQCQAYCPEYFTQNCTESHGSTISAAPITTQSLAQYAAWLIPIGVVVGLALLILLIVYALWKFRPQLFWVFRQGPPTEPPTEPANKGDVEFNGLQLKNPNDTSIQQDSARPEQPESTPKQAVPQMVPPTGIFMQETYIHYDTGGSIAPPLSNPLHQFLQWGDTAGGRTPLLINDELDAVAN